MNKLTFGKNLLLVVWGLLFIGIFFYLNSVDIKNCYVVEGSKKRSITLPFSHKSQGQKSYIYECEIYSPIDQNVKLGIVVDDILHKLIVNGKQRDLQKLKRLYGQKELHDWYTGYNIDLHLKQGINHLKILSFDKGGRYGLKIAQTLSFTEYLLLFFLGIVPLLTGLYNIVSSYVLDFDFGKIAEKFSWKELTIFILAIGIVLRLFYWIYVPNSQYQHDYSAHIETIKYFSEHPFTIPQADKKVEFPQQILYYEIAGIVYKLAKKMHLSEEDSIFLIRGLSFLLSVFWLYFAYKLSKIYLSSSFSRNIFLAFMAFTPAFVILSGAVNNDTLVALLSIWALYEIARYYLYPTKKRFYLATFTILLASLTKISSLLLAIYFVVVLMVLYKKTHENRFQIKKNILIFVLSVLFVFGFALLKAHIPASGEFRFVNSVLYSNQIIPYLDFNYFFSFHWFELIKQGMSYVFGSTEITHSLPTYLFGTMLTGEFDYSKFFKPGDFFKLSSQLIFFLGIIYVIGSLKFISRFKSLNTLHKLLMIPIVINLVLIIKFLSQFWVVCNSDFRYFAPVFGAIGSVFAIGLDLLINKASFLKNIIALFALFLAVDEIFWMYELIRFYAV